MDEVFHVVVAQRQMRPVAGFIVEGGGALQNSDEQIRRLASEYEVGVVDSFALFENYVNSGGDLFDLLSWANHPNRKGHQLVADELLRWFPVW